MPLLNSFRRWVSESSNKTIRRKPSVSFRPLLERLEDRLAPAACVWTGGGGNELASNSANWSAVPTGLDTLIINEPVNGIVTINIDSAFIGSVANLRINAPMIQGSVIVNFSRDFTVTNSLIQNGGVLGSGNIALGPGAVHEWMAGGVRQGTHLTIGTGGSLDILGPIGGTGAATITNNGFITFRNSGSISNGMGLIVENSGTIDFQGYGTPLNGLDSSDPIQIVNNGTIRKSFDDRSVLLQNVRLTAFGTINVESGAMRIQGIGTATNAQVTVAAGANLILDGPPGAPTNPFPHFAELGTQHYDINGLTVSGDGCLTVVDSAVLNLLAGGMTVDYLCFLGGTIGNSGTLTVNKDLYWSGGALGTNSGSIGVTNIAAGAILHVPMGSQSLGCLLNICGKIDWSNPNSTSQPGGGGVGPIGGGGPSGLVIAYLFPNLRTGETPISVKVPDGAFEYAADQAYRSYANNVSSRLGAYRDAETAAAQLYDIQEGSAASAYQAVMAAALAQYDVDIAAAEAALSQAPPDGGQAEEAYWDAVAQAEATYDDAVQTAVDQYQQQATYAYDTYVSNTQQASINSALAGMTSSFQNNLIGLNGLITGQGQAEAKAQWFYNMIMVPLVEPPPGFNSTLIAAWTTYLNMIPVEQVATQIAYYGLCHHTLTNDLNAFGSMPNGITGASGPQNSRNTAQDDTVVFGGMAGQMLQTAYDIVSPATNAVAGYAEGVWNGTTGFVRDVGYLMDNDPQALRDAIGEGLRDGTMITVNTFTFGMDPSLNQEVNDLVAQNGGLYRVSQISASVAREAVMSLATAGLTRAATGAASSLGGSLATRLGMTEATQASVACVAATAARLAQPVSAAIQINGIRNDLSSARDAYLRGDYETAVGAMMRSGMNAATLFGSLRETLRMARAFGSLDPQRVRDYLTNCFTAGTPIRGEFGAKPIEAYRVGDRVWARPDNDPNALAELKPIEECFVTTANVWHIHVSGQVIRTTNEHPFYVRNGGWTGAQKLQSGDVIIGLDLNEGIVEETYDTGETETVYNFRVADHHTYFVGDEDWGFAAWAHNVCVGPLPRPRMPQNQVNGFRVYGTSQETIRGALPTAHASAIDDRVAQITAQLRQQGVNPNDVSIILNRNWRTGVNGLGASIRTNDPWGVFARTYLSYVE